MKVIDTSAWIEWLINSPLAQEIAPILPENDEWIVPTIVQLELNKWLYRERDENTADSVIAFTQTCVVMPLTTDIALLAGDYHRKYKLATADAVVYATAISTNAELITCDAHFEGLPHSKYISKRTS